MKTGMVYKIGLLMILLVPISAKAQWSFDIGTVEAYINDHKQQRSLLLARSTLEHSNKLLHEYSREETVGYKELNVDLDKYTRAFDAIDVMYQSLRTALNVHSTYQGVSDRISDYKTMLEDFNEKVIKRKHIELADTLRSQADSIAQLPQIPYKFDKYGNMLWTSRADVARLGTLALAYRLYGDEKYLRAANEALLWVCNFPDLDP